ncbi:CEI_1a_G0010040.mRNA.1.CDS.1 [Saccharomyces cerevisiae]|nr:EM14S01-3B_G0044410.mRNA.1.CDS.1 [Saccharomyces cerevisiae]CAI4343334.1 AMH_1a_G0010080.mRNA.1.CDS.1 [Saccharomyces cerevisiae]CAI4352163.1 CEI_1a_G0010040.mRNA.1.CDS.1 [Saccharomyces cerevisiae]CAI6559468.1 AMH_1a_G0010080.mRNA.1.CDS.1 [Saccharomyces cerevisiae]CAI7202568.1 CEI_1a_G0010040.mRNA.1.CDS.1 [Saccharomyces cerevisiae]
MMKGSRRTGNNTATTLNTPVVIHATQLPQHVSTDEVLQFLESFIDEKENIIDSTTMNTISGNAADADAAAVANTSLNIDTNLSSSISQLKRIQRDFKGLPPAQDFSAAPIQVSTTEKKETSIGVSATGGKKTTFADEILTSERLQCFFSLSFQIQISPAAASKYPVFFFFTLFFSKSCCQALIDSFSSDYYQFKMLEKNRKAEKIN